MESPYSNREINQLFKGQSDLMEAGFRSVTEQIHDVTKIVERIEAQTIRTNGRVSALESWRSGLGGAWKLITWVGIPLFAIWVGFVSWSTTELLKLKESVRDTPRLVEQAIADELDTYVFEVTK